MLFCFWAMSNLLPMSALPVDSRVNPCDTELPAVVFCEITPRDNIANLKASGVQVVQKDDRDSEVGERVSHWC